MLSATLSSTAASAGLIVLWPGSKQKSRGTSIVTAPSLRWPMTTGVFSNQDASHLRSTASAAASSVFCSATLGATDGGDATDVAEGAGGGATLAQPKSASATIIGTSDRIEGGDEGETMDVIGAGCPNRTDDLPLTRRVLYQLS